MSNPTSNTPSWMLNGDVAPALLDEARPLQEQLLALLGGMSGYPQQFDLFRLRLSWRLAATATHAAWVLRNEIDPNMVIFVGENADIHISISKWLVDCRAMGNHTQMASHLTVLDGIFFDWLGKRADSKDYPELLGAIFGRMGKSIAKQLGGLMHEPNVLSISAIVTPHERRINAIRRMFCGMLSDEHQAACG